MKRGQRGPAQKIPLKTNKGGQIKMPSKNNNRIGRIDEEYRKELSQIIGYELKNPNVTGMISVHI